MGNTFFTGSLEPEIIEGFGTGSIVTTQNAYYTGSLMPTGGDSPTPTIPPTEPPVQRDYDVYCFYADKTVNMGISRDLNKNFSLSDTTTGAAYSFIYDGKFYRISDASKDPHMPTNFQPDVISATSPTGNANSATGAAISSNGEIYNIHSDGSGGYISDSSYSDVENAVWSKVSGWSYSDSTYGFAVCNLGLYIFYTYQDKIKSSYKISDISNWSKITGACKGADTFGYGISEGKLYYLKSTSSGGVTQIGSDTTWTDITGGRVSSSQYGYGINNGKLYALDSDTPTQVGNDTTWTKISGFYKAGSGMFLPANYALGINNGKLYTILGTEITQVGSSADWKGCGGFCTKTTRGLAYDSSALYYITTSEVTKLLDGEFVYCGGTFLSSGQTVALAVKVKEAESV